MNTYAKYQKFMTCPLVDNTLIMNQNNVYYVYNIIYLISYYIITNKNYLVIHYI